MPHHLREQRHHPFLGGKEEVHPKGNVGTVSERNHLFIQHVRELETGKDLRLELPETRKGVLNS